MAVYHHPPNGAEINVQRSPFCLACIRFQCLLLCLLCRSQATVLGSSNRSLSMAKEGLEIENVFFPPMLQPLGSSKKLILGGAGARGLDIKGKFIKYTAIGIYIEKGAVKYLAEKYKGRSGQALYEDETFFEDAVRSPFEKFVKVTLLLPLTGVQYSEKVLDQIAAQKLYTNLRKKDRHKFLAVFKDESFAPGSSILFSVSAAGLKVGFTKDCTIPEKPVTVIKAKAFGEAVLATILCKDGVSPAAKLSFAERLASWF